MYIFLAFLAVFIVIAMLIWPQATYQGSLYGLELWATVLVPSLLPFFIITEIILNLGIVNMLGVLLEPIMRPLFNLPGSAAFAVAMGFTSGFPMGAVLTKRLYEENHCNVSESERLIAFTNNSSPLFIMVAVGVGMFHNAELGIILALAHYTSNILYGFFLGRLSPKKNKQFKGEKNIIVKSIRVLIEAQNTRKPLGKMMGDAITRGISTITLIGGFVVFYSLLIRLLIASTLLNYIVNFLSSVLAFCGLNTILSSPFATGFWEITLGLKDLSTQSLTLQEIAVAGSILLGWSGLSIQSQVLSVISGTGISTKLYHLGRIFQGLAAGLIAFLLTSTQEYWSAYIAIPTSAFSIKYINMSSFTSSSYIYFSFTCKAICLFLALLILISLVIRLFTLLPWSNMR